MAWGKDKEQRANRLEGIQQQLKASRVASAPRVPPQWYVNGQGQTMVVIPGPVEFVMGSPMSEAGRLPNENQHRRRIGRTFALAAKSVTLAEYQRFDPAYRTETETEQLSPTKDCPVLGISWFQAAEYCNWLSKQEGLAQSEWCYVPVRDAKASPATAPEYKVGMELAANYLERGGYRLPTEAEIEFATRAGSVTSGTTERRKSYCRSMDGSTRTGGTGPGRWGVRSRMIWASSTRMAMSSHGARAHQSVSQVKGKRGL